MKIVKRIYSKNKENVLEDRIILYIKYHWRTIFFLYPVCYFLYRTFIKLHFIITSDNYNGNAAPHHNGKIIKKIILSWKNMNIFIYIFCYCVQFFKLYRTNSIRSLQVWIKSLKINEQSGLMVCQQHCLIGIAIPIFKIACCI